ncbi:hypothetical protein E2C01_015622 [Portunus trituberculatus]|uniref:Uncharacterized protein n=1 Tax=Portunus trituberculatus TaxID=210409 RepID=A0A5B7DNT3_PORTR|nr:hypothetical protein [Portunus trituberculatus]
MINASESETHLYVLITSQRNQLDTGEDIPAASGQCSRATLGPQAITATCRTPLTLHWLHSLERQATRQPPHGEGVPKPRE